MYYPAMPYFGQMKSEESRYVAGEKPLAFWVFLTLVSGVLIYEARAPNLLVTWGTSVPLVFILSVAVRLRGFFRRKVDLLTTGSSLTRYDYRQQHKKILLMLVVLILGFSPFVLASVMPPGIWLGSIVGVIDGWIVHLLVFNLYLRRWEYSNDGTLYKTEIWERARVVQTGIKFVRHEENHGR